MISKRRTISLNLVILLALACITIALRYGQGETSASAKGMKVKVLRRKDQLHVTPTAAEISDLRNRVQDAPVSPPKQERELDDRIPKHLPIRIRIKKDKEDRFRDLKNEKWARDFEIEVTNTGKKDIYFLSLGLFLPEIKAADGKDLSFPLYYGREELANLPAKARADDIPIKPGETFIFKLLENNALGYEAFNRALKKPLPKTVVLRFRMLNFGDGTGLMGWDGTFFPRGPDKSSSKCLDPPGADAQLSSQSRPSWQPNHKRTTTTLLPSSFLPAKFFDQPPLSASTTGNAQTCCAGDECLQSRRWTLFICVNCGPSDGINGAFCSDPLGICWHPIYSSVPCTNENGEPFLCPQVDVTPCEVAQSTPTPTTPSPSPTPEHCPLNCTDPLADLPADPCDTANNIPGTNCPIGYSQAGNCCYATCREPTYLPECPPGRTARWGWPFDCEWHCQVTLPNGGGGGGNEPPPGDDGHDYCQDWFWVLWRYDEQLGWIEVDTWFAFCA